MKRRGGYLGGSTVVLPGSGWYSNEFDPTLEDYRPTFQEILDDFINEEIATLLDSEKIQNGDIQSSSCKRPSSDAAEDAPKLVGYDPKTQDPQLYVPAEEGRKFAKKRTNSPFKRPKRKPVIEYKSKKDRLA